MYWLHKAEIEKITPQKLDVLRSDVMPPLKWSTFWDMIVPFSGVGNRYGLQIHQEWG